MYAMRIDTLPSRNKAFSLVEAAIVLGVVGLVIGGIWVAASSTMDKFKRDNLISGLLQLVVNARNIIPASMADSTWKTIDMITTGIAPSSLLGNCTTDGGGWGQDGICNSYNGSYGLGVAPVGSVSYNAPNGALMLTVTNIPQAACIDLLTRVSSKGSNDLLNAGNPAGTNKTSSFPIPPNTPICSSSSNDIYLFFNFARLAP